MQPQLSLRQYQQLMNKQQEFKNPQKQPNYDGMLNCPKQQKKYKSYGSYNYSTLRNTKHRTKVLYQKSKDYATSLNALANLPKLNGLTPLQPKPNQMKSGAFVDGHQASETILCQLSTKAQTQPQLRHTKKSAIHYTTFSTSYHHLFQIQQNQTYQDENQTNSPSRTLQKLRYMRLYSQQTLIHPLDQARLAILCSNRPGQLYGLNSLHSYRNVQQGDTTHNNGGRQLQLLLGNLS